MLASDAIAAQRLLNAALKNWQVNHPQLAARAEKNLAEGFAVFDLPEARRVRMRTTNGLERLNKELKRQTRWIILFPNPASCLAPGQCLAGRTRRGVNDRKTLPVDEALSVANHQHPKQNLGNLQKTSFSFIVLHIIIVT